MAGKRQARKARQRARQGDKGGQQQLSPTPKPKPKVPMEDWSIERPFDSSDFLNRRAAPTYETEGQDPPAK